MVKDTSGTQSSFASDQELVSKLAKGCSASAAGLATATGWGTRNQNNRSCAQQCLKVQSTAGVDCWLWAIAEQIRPRIVVEFTF